MSEQRYSSVLEYGAIKDYSLPFKAHWEKDDAFDILQKLSHPFGYRSPSTAHFITHVYPSHIDDCKFLESIDAEEYTCSTEWAINTSPTLILKEDDGSGYYEFYYSNFCTNDNLMFFKLKCAKTPKYIGDTTEDFTARLCGDQEWRDSSCHLLSCKY